MKYKSKNEKETKKIASDLTKSFYGGEIILLSGDLGAGKTVFVKGLAKALGIKNIVKSPTFNIMKCYSIPKRYTLNAIRSLCHIDAYRLENLDDLLDIGVEDYIDDERVVVVEWAEKVKGIEKLAEKVIKIKIKHGKKENEREITID